MMTSLRRRLTVGRDIRDTRWLTRTVALLAIAVFTVSGAQIFPAMTAAHHSHPISRGEIAAFLLNIALILFAWRRSVQLQRVSVQRFEAEDRAHQLAYYDELTGLLNRRRLNETLAELSSASGGGKSALVLIDLDQFKRVNDLLGHAAGDQLLSAIASRIRSACPLDAECFRLGGDEFAVILSGTMGEPREAMGFAEELLQSLIKPVVINNTKLAVTASIGIAAVVRKRRDRASVLERADMAMYEAKRLGRNRCLNFEPEMERQLEERRRFEAELRDGIDSGQFVPFFQPIFDLESGEMTGFEVLARWQHPGRGLLEPADFLATAERTGLISDLSFRVMHEALTIARAWPSHLRISVNVSPVQFNDPLIAQRIVQVISQTGFPAKRLEIEIMEKSLLEDLQNASAIIASLKNSGISVSVDDFGTTYGSIAQLKTLPFDRIKIDRSFIATLLDDERCDALVDAIATLGKGLKLPITAEGVEADALREKLLALGCTDAQGWVYARALSPREVSLGYGNRWDSVIPDALVAAADEPGGKGHRSNAA